MEKDTVCISIETFERFKNAEIENVKLHKHKHTVYVDDSFMSHKISTDEDAVAQLAEAYKMLVIFHDKKKRECEALRSEVQNLECSLECHKNAFKKIHLFNFILYKQLFSK